MPPHFKDGDFKHFKFVKPLTQNEWFEFFDSIKEDPNFKTALQQWIERPRSE